VAGECPEASNDYSVWKLIESIGLEQDPVWGALMPLCEVGEIDTDEL
jgi:hypothetical protein